MRHRPNVEDKAIHAAIRNVFKLQLLTVTFLPVGEGSWAYRGTDETGQSWFIKLSRQENPSIERITTYLHNRLGLSFVLAPLMHATSEQPKVGDYYLTVYPFIEGVVLGGTDLNRYKAEIGHDLRALHGASLPPELTLLLPRESFDKFQISARELVAKARSYEGGDTLKQRLMAYMQAQAGPIDAILKNGAQMSDYCKHRAHSYELVVCHADIHPFNIMHTVQGLVFIDWDGIMLAPRERDLTFYAADMRTDGGFRQAYGTDVTLNEGLATYYLYEWVLQEFTDYIGRLFDETLGDDARSHALDEFQALFGSGGKLGGVVRDALDAPMAG